MKVVLAPDSFGGTLTAVQAARAAAMGWQRVRPHDQIVMVPMADGGEGMLDVVAYARPDARRHTVEVADARARAVTATWLELDERGVAVAVVEAASAVGLAMLEADERDPLTATSFGVGMLLRAAVEAGARRVLVGLGGSATVDGGAGALTALGYRLLRADGNGLKIGAAHLTDLAAVRPGRTWPVPVDVAVDVRAPLLGARGAARVYGPQKGASPDDVEVLEAGIAHFADVVERDLRGGPWRDLPGAGAAGGLGFALAASGARLVEGAAAVADLVGFDDALSDADIVVTGEGRLDSQTAEGKVAEHVRRCAARVGATTVAIVGSLQDGAGGLFDVVRDLGPRGLQHAADLVAEQAAEVARSIRPAISGTGEHAMQDDDGERDA